MEIHGKLVVTVTDGVNQYHSNGGWVIRRNGAEIAASIDHEVYQADAYAVRERLKSVAIGDTLEATSYTGKTGAIGVIVARAGNTLVIEGKSWGRTQYAPHNRVGFNTHTFDIVGAQAYYCGSLRDLRGMVADHTLVRRVEAFVREQDAPQQNTVDESPLRAPMWVKA